VRITYIGHATLLIEIAGKRLLTDPNFDPTLGRFLPRVAAPGLAIDRLPQLDAILVTHAHADHVSPSSLDALPRDVPIYAPPTVERWLRGLQYTHAQVVPPGGVIELGELTIHAAAATHRGARYGVDRWRSDANMYLLDSGAESCFFAGDTALTPESHHLVEDHLAVTGRMLDVALLPIGHGPWWKPGFRRGHLTSDDALILFERLQARYLIPYHWGTFRHLTSGPYDAIARLHSRLIHYPQRGQVKVLEPGQVFELAPKLV
jgi:L-ascorbate metabolism protein UlaG (beta-lactamase superfamily)